MLKRLFQKRQSYLPLDTRDWVALALGLAVFAIISLWTITKSSIWFDEAFGAYLIRFDFWEVARYTATDVHPPFYYWLLKIWSMIFGTSELALRSMSVFFGAVAIFLGYLLTKRLFNRNVALFSLLFMMLTPMFIRYSQEMRMYTLVTAIALAATYVLTIAMESKSRKPWILYGILVSLGMWTHYFSALIWISHWLWRAWVIGRTHRKRKALRAFFSKDWIVAHIVAVGLFIPWIPALAYQVLTVQINGFWIPPVSPVTLPNFFTNVLYYQEQDTVNSWLTLLLLVILVALVTLAVRLYRTQKEAERQNYMLIFTVAFVPMLLLFLLSMPPLRSSFTDRYLVTSTVGISLFIGVTLALSGKVIRPRWQKGITFLIAGAMIIGIGNVYYLGNYNKTLQHSNNTRQIVEAITAEANEPIVADSPWLFYEAVFYSTPTHPVYFLNSSTDYKYGSLDMLEYNDQFKIKDIKVFSKNHKTVWYVGRPGHNELTPPHAAWKQLQKVEVHDSVSGQPSYKAVQYKTNN